MPSRFDPMYDTDKKKGDAVFNNDGDEVFQPDFKPSTILESNKEAVKRGASTAGGRGSIDTEAAKRLGSQGKE